MHVQPIPLGVTFSNVVSKLKAQSSKLDRLFSLKRGKRALRALSFELSKMSPQVGLAVSRLAETELRQSQGSGLPISHRT